MRKPLKIKELSKSKICLSILIALLSGLFWAIMPFFGWSEYSLEGVMIWCNVEWQKRSLSVASYNVAKTIFVFALPLFLFIFTNFKIFKIVSKSF